MIVTIFKDILATSAGFHRPVESILKRIKEGKSKKLISEIRREEDYNKRNKLKRGLPAICFSGKFNRRADNAIIEHSGLICLDFDKFPDDDTLKKERKKLTKDKYTFALFTSPSGAGLKVIVKIPADVETHREYFKSLQLYYDSPYFDKSCINESRVCYESYDPNLYLNDDSEVFLQKIEDEQYEVGVDKAVLPITSENQIINNLQKWFDKNYTMTEGSRNSNLYKLACAFNDFGVSQLEAEKELSKYKARNFTAREIETIIISAYKNTANFRTKFFEDDFTKGKIKERVRAGDDIKKIQKSFPNIKVEEVIDDIKESLSISEFWDYDRNNKIILSHHKYKRFLEQNGFFKMYPEGSDNFVFVLIKENLISNTTVAHIKDFVLSYLYKTNIRVYDYLANNTKYFREEYLNFLDATDIHLKEDTKNECYLYFKNYAVAVSAKKIKTIDYLELDGFVWEKHIIDRDFVEADPTGCVFERFLVHVVGNNKERFSSIVSIIGYLLHSFKSSSNNKCIIFNDETISDSPNGGSGKGIICNAIGQMKRVATLDGKRFDFNKTFSYQTVAADTQVLVFDDVRMNFEFESLFSLITEGITLEKKNRDAIKLPVKKSPKIVITTNYTIRGSGGSFVRRKLEVELSSFFNDEHTPFDEFGHMLFDDWDSDEWAKFDNFMIHCVQYYLNTGLLSYEFHNLDTRKLITNTSYDFYEWMNDEKLMYNQPIYVTEYYDKFIEEHKDHLKFCTRRKFGQWLDMYARHHGATVIKGKANGQRYTMYEIKELSEADSSASSF